MVAFALAVFFLIITPGPGVLSVAGVGAAYGLNTGLRYFFGLLVGANIAAILVVSGLISLILANPNFRFIMSVISIIFLLIVAFRIAFAGTRVAFTEVVNPPNILDAITLQLVNPKVYTVHMALFSGFAYFPGDLFLETLTKFVIINLISAPIHLIWLFAGLSLHKINLSTRSQIILNIVMSISMLSAVGLATFLPNY